MATNKKQPAKTVMRITCPKCGELQLKIYPWASFQLPVGAQVPVCKKCQ